MRRIASSSSTGQAWRRPQLWMAAWGVYVCVTLVASACLQPPESSQICTAVKA